MRRKIMKNQVGSKGCRAGLALVGSGLALAATACVEPPYRNEVSVAGQGGAVTLHREPKPPAPPPPPPPAPVVIYVPATAPAAPGAPAAADAAPLPAAPADEAERQRRIQELEARMRQEQAEVQRLRSQTAPSDVP